MIHMVKIILGILMSIGLIECKKAKFTADVKFLSIATTPNTEFVEYCNIGITPGSNGHSFDMKTYLLKNISKDLHIGLVFYVKNKNHAEYQEFFDYGFNVCRLMDGFMSQTVARLWSSNVKKCSNLPLSCPVNQGEYYVRKMKIDRKSVPMVAMSGIYMAKVHIYVKKGSTIQTVANTTLEAEVRF